MTPRTVSARGLTKRYGELLAVDGVDLDVATGTVVAVLGPNGAGKTTLVRMIATLETPTAGALMVCGYDVATDSHAVRSALSLTGQFAALEDNLTARENLILMARLRGLDRRRANTTVDGLIERFDIGEFRGKLIKTLSGGQRRRVDLAASLVVQPQLLILDEPTTGLDPRSRQVVWSTVRDLVNEGVTLLLTTQYLEEADMLADAIILMDHGRSVAAGTPSELKAQIGQQRVDVTTIDLDGFDALKRSLADRFTVSGERDTRILSIPAPTGSADLAAVAAAVRDSGVGVDEVALRRPSLDEAFMALTGSRTDCSESPARLHLTTPEGAAA
ncbi:MAG TPA: ATP-binding cassette domain-containing protein [Ilumatobacteraceae bacterium]